MMISMRGASAERARRKLMNTLEGRPVVLVDGGENAVHIVDAYKHVGGIVASDGSMRREIAARISSASAALQKLRRPLANQKLPPPVKKQLVDSLVMSRLLTSAATWTSLDSWCWTKLHAFRMQVLRRMSGQTWGQQRSGGKYLSDDELLKYLDEPSIQCLVQRARLRALPTILGCPLDALGAMLSARSPRDGRPVAWTDQIRKDLGDLRKALPTQLGSLGNPLAADEAKQWFDMIVRYPGEWADLVDRLWFQGRSLGAERAHPTTGSGGQRDGAYACEVCGERGFRTQKALDQHARVKHGKRCDMNRYVATASCPVCGKGFADRLRVIAHLSETRVRARHARRSCREVVLAGGVVQLDDSVVETLDGEARRQRRAARRAGHTRPVVSEHQRANKRPLEELTRRPAKRLRVKTADRAVEWKLCRPREEGTQTVRAKKPRHTA